MTKLQLQAEPDRDDRWRTHRERVAVMLAGVDRAVRRSRDDRLRAELVAFVERARRKAAA